MSYPTMIPKTPLWNPTQVLGIINQDYHSQTCIGYAPSQRRRCRNPIRADNRAFIADVCREISYLRPDSPAVLKRLRSIAGPALCVRYHQGQAEDVLREWKRRVRQVEVDESEPKSTKSARSEKIGSHKKRDVAKERTLEDAEEELREMREQLEEIMEHFGYQNREQEERDAEHRREEERKCQREENRKEKIRLEKERLETERLEKEQQAKNEKKRQDHERNERIRQRAQKRREEAEHLAREKAQKEREEWESLWETYQERWVVFKASASRDREDIPWPVRAGQDVVASTVKEFFQNAAPREAKVIKKESMKWHPNCPSSMHRLRQLSVVEGMRVEMICRVLTGLIDDCAEKGAECFEA